MTEQEFETIYNSLVRLMFKVLCKFHLRNDEDAISEARLALYKAIKTYNKDRNVKLSNYAYECIQNKLLAYIRIRKKDIPRLNYFFAVAVVKSRLYQPNLHCSFLVVEFRNKSLCRF